MIINRRPHRANILVLFAFFALSLGAASASTADDSQVYSLSPELRQQSVDVLKAGLAGEEFWPSVHAAEGLTLGGHGADVIAAFAKRLPLEKDDQRRCGLARELVRAGQRWHTRVMLDILTGDDPHGHVHAAESLFKVHEIGDGVAMRRAWQTGATPNLRMMSAAALAAAGNPEALDFLRAQLAGEDPEVTRIAAWILGRIGDTSDVVPLKENVATAPTPLSRAFLQHALAALGDAGGLAALTENLRAEDPAVRTYAATFAGDARAVSLAPELEKMLVDEHLDARLRAAQSLLVLARPPAPDRHEDISNLVYPATTGNPRYTEGSVLALRDGSLLFATTEFQNSGSDFAKARLVGRRSADEGRTWSDAVVLQENTGALNVMSVTLRRIEPSGKIGMFYLQKDGFDDLHAFVRYSTDEARTFGALIQVTSGKGYHVMNNDRVTQLSSGRLLAPVAFTNDVKKENHFVSFCFISDDEGLTWRRGQGHVDAPRRGAMEPEVVELADGRVLMIMRTQLGHIATSVSPDGGETWGERRQLSVKAPEAPATLRTIPATGDLVLIWNNTFTPGAGHGGKRTPLAAAFSSDEGRTWHNVRNLETNPKRTFSYTSLAFVGSRAVMSYWESGPGAGQLSSRFRSLPVRWFYQSSASVK
jgi:sialidase-1